MIAIDTNVLLRYLLGDDELQSRKASKLILGNDFVYLSHVVLVETVWTLIGKKYKLTPNDIDMALTALFEEENIVVQEVELTWRALLDFRRYSVESKGKIDFPDVLILNQGKSAAIEYDEPFDGFYTFDNAAQKLPGAFSP